MVQRPRWRLPLLPAESTGQLAASLRRSTGLAGRNAASARTATCTNTSTSCQMLGGVRLGRVQMGTIRSCGERTSNLWLWGRYELQMSITGRLRTRLRGKSSEASSPPASRRLRRDGQLFPPCFGQLPPLFRVALRWHRFAQCRPHGKLRRLAWLRL